MACTTILVGNLASNDGSTIIARNDDNPTGTFHAKKWIVTPAKDKASTYVSKISKVKIPFPAGAERYVSMPNVNKKTGLWCAAGINSSNVGMTATETITTNNRVLGADPLVKGGIGEEDLVAIVVPFIKSAREGVLRLGSLLEKYGTYENNGIAFNDAKEVWWLETIGGHHFIAKRVKDNEVVIMPNQFGLDNFDFADAMKEQKENICSSDLFKFVKDNHLDLGDSKHFNPRLAFGSHTDSDHVYNTPRAFALLNLFEPHDYRWNDKSCGYDEFSNDLPWSIVPDHKVSVEDVKDALANHFQNTPYDPYLNKGDLVSKGKYRPIGISRTSFLGLLQIRPYVSKENAALYWLSFASNPFNALVPFYANINRTPKYLSNTTDNVDSNNFYWANRLIADLCDSHYDMTSSLIERYQEAVGGKAYAIIAKYDKLSEKQEVANEEIAKMLKEETTKLLNQVVYTTSCLMKNSFAKSDK
jgi:dipeptidase